MDERSAPRSQPATSVPTWRYAEGRPSLENIVVLLNFTLSSAGFDVLRGFCIEYGSRICDDQYMVETIISGTRMTYPPVTSAIRITPSCPHDGSDPHIPIMTRFAMGAALSRHVGGISEGYPVQAL